GRGKAGGERALNVLQRRLDLACQRHRIGSRLFLDANDYSRLAVVAGFAAFRARREVHAGNLFEENRLMADHHHRMAQILESPCKTDIANHILAGVRIAEPAAGVRTEPRHGLLDLIMRDVERLHGRHVGRNAELTNLAADGNDLGDARQGEQLWPQHEVRHLADIHRRNSAIAGQCDQHDFAHDRRHGPHLWVDGARQLLANERKTLGHELASAIDVHAPIKFDVHDGEADAGYRPYADDTRHAVHGGLDRERDELLHLLGVEALCLRQDIDVWPIEIRKHIDGDTRQHE